MKKNKRKIKEKLIDKYRLVIVNDDTFEEKFSINLTRLNVFVWIGFFTIVLIALTTVLIAFTPLREFIPGYSSTKLKKKAYSLAEKTDSLTLALQLNKQQLNSIRRVLTGDVFPSKEKGIEKKVLKKFFTAIPTTKEDSLLRKKVAQEDKYNLVKGDNNTQGFVLFPPVKGTISEAYNIKEKHYAVDIVIPKNTPIKAVANGTIIFAEWTAKTGNVIIIEHVNQLISVYKHNSSLTKVQGDLVKSGEVIAFSGNTGEFSTGPHLHFELWRDGYALNPTDFINF